MSGSSTQTQNSFNTSEIGSPTVQKAGTSLIDTLSSEYPNWSPYTGATAAGVTAPQSTATDYATGTLGQTGAAYGNAGNTLQDIINTIGSPSQTASDIQGYMNPYVSATLAPTLENLNIANQQGQQAVGANATAMGQFGGTAQGVQQALNNNFYQQNVANATGQAYSNAYNSAVNQQQQSLQDLLNAAGGQTSLGNAGTSLASLLGSLGTSEQGIGQQGITNDINLNTQNNNEPLTQGATLASILASLPQQQTQQGYSQSSTPNNIGLALLGSVLSGI